MTIMDSTAFQRSEEGVSVPNNRIGDGAETVVLPGFSTGEPSIEHLDAEQLLVHGVYGFNSRDMRSRPFNLLRAQFLKAARAKNWKILGVTSATPRVGKSFVAANLAAALSRTPDLDVYLFDFDLRRSTQANNFQLDGEVGLADFLSGDVPDLSGIARRIGGERLMLVPSYPNAALSAELLASARMDALIAGMRAAPDNAICICDLPPVFANDDAVIVAQKIDAFMLVVEEGRTTRKQVKDALALLAPAPFLGTVLNRYRGGLMGDDYGYGYGQKSQYADYYGS